ncbi:MAG: hypothetical protein Q8L06_13360 [Pseudohongiella sp.]|nr:hypothetical protein [Pseudohongiella sp.]
MTLPQERAVKRQAICLQLQANRKLLNRQIQITLPSDNDAYPRSLIMRAMAKQPALTVVLATEVLPLLISQFLEWSAKKRRKKAV